MDMTIKTLTERHPESVAQLLKAYGYDAAPTEKNLRNLVKLYGNTPLPVSNATDDSTEKKPTLNAILDTLVKGATAVSNVVSAVKGGQIQKKVEVTPNDYESPATPRIAGINRTLFIALAGLTVITLTIILFRHKK